MFSFSFVLVMLALLGGAYYFTMKYFDLKKKEVMEKLQDAKEIEEIYEEVKNVNVSKIKRKKGKIDELNQI
jgi:predicted nucleotidyltransferase